MVCHVVYVEVFVAVVPTDYVKEVIKVENVIAEGTDFGEGRVTFHEVFVDIKAEAFLGANSLVEAAEYHDSFAVDRHAHCKITGCPC